MNIITSCLREVVCKLVVQLAFVDEHHPLQCPRLQLDSVRCHAPNVFGTVDMEKVSR